MESIDQTNLDRMFFALSELKKNGIYWCIDLLTNRQIKSGVCFFSSRISIVFRSQKP
ncbi:MAG: hypothetical protein IJZ19_07640 [Lentisphaeria bacterium]|nr:hypothetical protein [Lentisphaeria bacterium]